MTINDLDSVSYGLYLNYISSIEKELRNGISKIPVDKINLSEIRKKVDKYFIENMLVN